ncbi:MAG: cytochrome C peroxidase [Saprospiraceae bacterium]|nr:cytochrome C peroxidase [Saprospiraceae bacterium]
MSPDFRNARFGNDVPEFYKLRYDSRLDALQSHLDELLHIADAHSGENQASVLERLPAARRALKAADFWMRYVDPIQYRRVHGVLPVEWEVEVFEKWEPPYLRVSGGLFLLETYLEEPEMHWDSARVLLRAARESIGAFRQDSNRRQLDDPAHFYFANRLFLLNLAAIYTTGFECPDSSRIIPELYQMLLDTREIYRAFGGGGGNEAFPTTYDSLYEAAIAFVAQHTARPYSEFDHFYWIRDYVQPLYALNAGLIRQKRYRSRSLVDYALSDAADRIFSKNLYRAQEERPLFRRASDSIYREVVRLGEQLFYEPLLSGNNQRSCASCHLPSHFFTDTSVRTPINFDRTGRLERNAPSLINASLNHLILVDGEHLSLMDQLIAVHKKVDEMNGDERTTMQEILSCDDYRNTLSRLAAHTVNPKPGFEHVAAAIIAYYTAFDTAGSAFDDAINALVTPSDAVRHGFNLFMGRAQCATCHFPPHFGGIKPPYSGNEFEVLGVPDDSTAARLSPDPGRYRQLAVPEMQNAFRTGSLRNVARTKPYMHNGAFSTLEEVIEFYNAGGGAGKGLNVPGQTLSSDSLRLSDTDKRHLLRFLDQLDEHLEYLPGIPMLPASQKRKLNRRVAGGVY